MPDLAVQVAISGLDAEGLRFPNKRRIHGASGRSVLQAVITADALAAFIAPLLGLLVATTIGDGVLAMEPGHYATATVRAMSELMVQPFLKDRRWLLSIQNCGKPFPGVPQNGRFS
jgi:hypothetical protein